jgi:hypothetical protein
MPKMGTEIKFVLEDSDIECDFVPDFVVSANHTDETKISWRLSDNRSEIDVGVLFPGVPVKNPIHPPGSDRDNL